MSLETNKALLVLHGKITARVELLEQWLSAGTAKDYAEYQVVCGKIQGLLEACRYTVDLNTEIEENPDE